MAIKSVQGHYLTYYQIMATNNPCYKQGSKRSSTSRLILHSVGCNNAWLKRWISPDDGQIGDDGVYNGWNTTTCDTLVHFVIGLDKNGISRAYQMAPLDLRVWGCGSGSRGSGNNIAIQVEMTEDTSMGSTLAKKNYAVAVNLFASLCKQYGLSSSAIWSHKEACAAGYASNHGDPESWFKSSGSGLTMDGFRKDVQTVLNTGVPYGSTAAAPGYTVGWNKNDTGWWYVHNDGSYTTNGWEQINGEWYYFDNKGYMVHDCSVEYNGKIYFFDSNGHVTVTESKKDEPMNEEDNEMRYEKMKDVTSATYRKTLDKLVDKGILAGKGGSGDDMIIDFSEDTVRTLVILDRAGVFGK